MKFVKFILILLLLSGCTTNNTVIENKDEKQTKVEYKNWTQAKKIVDFYFLYNTLKDNYPFFDVLKRETGYDWLAHKSEFLQLVKDSEDDIEYYNIINEMVSKLNNSHTKLLDTNYYDYVKTTLNNVPEEHKHKVLPYLEVINNTRSINTYKYIYNILGNNNSSSKEAVDNTSESNIELKIIKTNKIAYVKINSFDLNSKDSDKEKLLHFWDGIKDYPYLIIDITPNSGGSDLYWIENIISPLISEPLEATSYSLYRGGEYSLYFVETLGLELYPVNELNSNLNYPNEINDFKFYSKSIKRIEPNNPVGFTGEVYVLTSNNNYSSAEDFVNYVKSTNWATLVGETTSGGLGIDPIYFSLPNTGLIIQFPIDMALNPDGSSNEEFHTIPDININAEDSLNTVLSLINNK